MTINIYFLLELLDIGLTEFTSCFMRTERWLTDLLTMPCAPFMAAVPTLPFPGLLPTPLQVGHSVQSTRVLTDVLLCNEICLLPELCCPHLAPNTLRARTGEISVKLFFPLCIPLYSQAPGRSKPSGTAR
jgi:hypothetical protein